VPLLGFLLPYSAFVVGKLDQHQVTVNSKLDARMSPRSRWGIILGCASLACLTWFAHGDLVMFTAALFVLFLLAYNAFVVGKLDRHQVSVNSKLDPSMSLSSLWGTILGCAFLAFASWPVLAGFMVVLAVPLLGFLLPYSAFVTWSEPARRRLQAVKVCLWLAV